MIPRSFFESRLWGQSLVGVRRTSPSPSKYSTDNSVIVLKLLYIFEMIMDDDDDGCFLVFVMKLVNCILYLV